MNLELIIVLFYSYFLGSIPFGLIITKIFLKKDIRTVGSGNIGTTNVLRTGNKSLAFATLIFDILKGYFSVLITLKFFNDLIYFSALICFIAHIFPIWLKFKGGKGVATYIGYLLAFNISLFLLFVLIWLFIAIFKRYSSLASIISLLSLPLFMIIFSYKINHIYLISIISVIIILKHYSNILRLFNKTESKIKL